VSKELTVLVATALMLAMMLASAGMDLKRRRRSVARPRGLLASARTHNAVQVQNCTSVRCQGTLLSPSYPQVEQ
jgi:hypothetical protein